MGQEATFGLRDARPNSPAMLLLGATQLNVPLDVMGMRGCFQYTQLIVLIAIQADANGHAGYRIPIPCNHAWVGTVIRTAPLV